MAKSIYIPAGRLTEHKPNNPDRTAYRIVRASPSSTCWGDVEVKEFPNRPAMLKTIEMQSRAEPSAYHWREWRWQ